MIHGISPSGFVLAVFFHALGHIRFQRLASSLKAHIEIADNGNILEFGHPACHKTAILADGVAAHRECVSVHILEESQHLLFNLRIIQHRGLHLFDRPDLPWVDLSRIHSIHHAVRLSTTSTGASATVFSVVIR